ncbi:OmpW/AlkL family protein [Algiphilus sp.]|uniref:OmpW/AlkL family protein n=1 Tax=Algiphilus sp. TaxID=1872431 RepID=UPI003C69504E
MMRRLGRASVALAMLALAMPASAYREGALVLQAGWFHLAPQESSEPLRTRLAPSVVGSLLGIDPDFTSEGTSTGVSNAHTPALTLSYYLTDHWVLKAEGGVPAEFDLYGDGVVRPTGPSGLLINVDLGAPENNPIASARQWSPAILLQRYFRDASARLRPYLGVGASYTWFTNVELKPAFSDALNRNFGRSLAVVTGNPGRTVVRGDSDSAWAPIVNAGLSYALTDRLSLSLSLSYLFLSTTSRITIEAADGTRLAESTTELDLGTAVSSLLLSWRWGDGG